MDVAVVGKYVDYGDSYKSLNEALAHGGIANNVRVKLHYVDAETLEGDSYPDVLFRADAILVPGGFGRRGVEGMMRAIRYAREKKVPFFGICLGLQTAVIEYARNVAGLEGANSTEFDDEPKHRVIFKLRDLIGVEALGGTMRLGKYPCELAPGSFAARAYGEISDLGAAPPPLRGQPGVPAASHARPASPSRGCRPTRSSSRSSSSTRTTRGSWAASSTRS